MRPSKRVLGLVWLLAVGCDEPAKKPTASPPSAPAGKSSTRRASHKEVVEDEAPVADAGVVLAVAQLPKKRPKSIVLAEAREEATRAVADGFLAREAIVDDLMQLAERESLRTPLADLVDELLAEHRVREQSWHTLTDPDRLDRAFGALEKEGVLARQRLRGCEGCAYDDLRDVAESQRAKHKRVIGFVYFTEEDAVGLGAGAALELSFGTFDDDETGAETRRIGKRVVAALTKAGLRPQWNGSDEEPIALPNLEWHKRRFTKSP